MMIALLTVLELLGSLPADLWKWHGGVMSRDALYGAPSHANSVLRIVPSTGNIVVVAKNEDGDASHVCLLFMA